MEFLKGVECGEARSAVKRYNLEMGLDMGVWSKESIIRHLQDLPAGAYLFDIKWREQFKSLTLSFVERDTCYRCGGKGKRTLDPSNGSKEVKCDKCKGEGKL
jgi:hypothetical protein